MNPLTLVKRIQNINSKEAALGISEGASWHAKYKESAYVFVGGIPFDLTEGDLLAVFAQYGEIVDVNLVRDKGTGKSKGFAFVAYEDQRSTNLAVDNLNGAQILGRIIRVDHVSKYKKKEQEDEEEEQRKREARGVCRAFQKGECTRGAGCKFSHDEQRAANTGWGSEDKTSTWGHDKYEGQPKREGRGVCYAFQKGECTRGAGCKFSHDEQRAANTGWGSEDKTGHDKFEGQTKRDRRSGLPEHTVQEGFRSSDKDIRRSHDRNASSKPKGDDRGIESHQKRNASYTIDKDSRGLERRSEWKEKGMNNEEDRDRRDNGKRSRRTDYESASREDDRREETRSTRHKSDSYPREDRDKNGGGSGGGRLSTHSTDYSSHHHRDEDSRRKSDR